MSLHPQLQKLERWVRGYLRLAKPGRQTRGSVIKARLILAGLALGYGLLAARLLAARLSRVTASRRGCGGGA